MILKATTIVQVLKTCINKNIMPESCNLKIIIESFQIKMMKQTLPLELHWTVSQLNPSDSWTWHTSPNAEIKCLVGIKSIIYFTFQKFYLNACIIITVKKKIILSIIQWFFPSVCTVADPDLQITGGPGHPDPEIRGGGGLQKNFFRPLWIRHCCNPPTIHYTLNISWQSDRTHWLPVGCEEYDDDHHHHHHGHHLHHHHDTLLLV